MRKEQKAELVENILENVNTYAHLYLTDINGLDAETTSTLRRKCFEKDVKLTVVKNTLLKIALDKAEGDYEELYQTLVGNTAVMFSNTGNVPAKLIKEIRKDNDKPILKGAYVEESIYLGDDKIEVLSTIKSKDELIGDVIALLQSPVKNVVSALQSGGHTLSGLVKTLSER
jgi:large subunit ribosomal protein L10